jgi:hypothetical protein
VIAERKPWIRPVEVIIIAVGILLCVGLFVTFQQNRVLTDVQSQGIERGYKNRAVTCDLQTALGVGNSRECADPAIRPYRDPAVTPTAGAAEAHAAAQESRDTRALVCMLFASRDLDPPQELCSSG